MQIDICAHFRKLVLVVPEIVSVLELGCLGNGAELRRNRVALLSPVDDLHAGNRDSTTGAPASCEYNPPIQ